VFLVENSLTDIIKRLQKGKRDAFAQLYSLYSKKLYPICLRYSRSTQEAEDNLQEAFITVFKKIRTYKGEGSFDGWIKRIFINQCLGELRKPNYILNEETYDNITEDNNDETIKIEISSIIELIQELPTQYRIVFNMYALDSYSHEEISRELLISTGTSKSNLSRAKHILRRRIQELENE
jgi:RNA polymerase sigma-70 factor (ECF subfamily)